MLPLIDLSYYLINSPLLGTFYAVCNDYLLFFSEFTKTYHPPKDHEELPLKLVTPNHVLEGRPILFSLLFRFFGAVSFNRNVTAQPIG